MGGRKRSWHGSRPCDLIINDAINALNSICYSAGRVKCLKCQRRGNMQSKNTTNTWCQCMDHSLILPTQKARNTRESGHRYMYIWVAGGVVWTVRVWWKKGGGESRKWERVVPSMAVRSRKYSPHINDDARKYMLCAKIFVHCTENL